MQKPEITTIAYESAHGRRPSGRGSWAFASVADWRLSRYNSEAYNRFFWFNGLYADAKRAALAHFDGKAEDIVVCS